MKEIHLDQGTQDWLNWRSGAAFADIFGVQHDALDGLRVTATAASVCGGHSPFNTAHRLWCETMGLVKKEGTNFAMIRGSNLEPKARKAYMDIVGSEYEALCIESSTTPWIAASLDGVDILRSRGVEIKCPISEKGHDLAMLGLVPDYYEDQIQWQLLASDGQIKEIDYFSYAPQIGFAAPITVKPNPVRQAELLQAATLFRLAVLTGIPLSGSEFDQAAKACLILKREIDALDVKFEAAKELLKKIADGKPMQGGGMMVTVGNSDGRVSWEKVALNLAEQLSLTSDDLDKIKESHKGKASKTISVKEGADANAVFAQLKAEMANRSETSVDQTTERLNQPTPIW